MRATWFNQPWVAEKLEPGAELLLTGKLTGKGFTVNEWELVSGGGRGESSGSDLRPRPRGDRGAARRSGSANGPSRRSGWAPNAVEGLPAELRARRGLAGGRRRDRAPPTSPSPRRSSRRPGSGSPSRSSSSTRRCSPRANAAAGRRGRRRGWAQPGERVARWLDSLPFAPTADQRERLRRHRRRPRLRRADGAALDGRGRLRQDRGRRLRDAAGARSRLPGGADGADRDARRAARDHPRPAARRRRRSRSRC